VEIKEAQIQSQNKLGEGPLWHPDEDCLYWVDIHQNRVEQYIPQTGLRKTIQFDSAVTALGIRQKGGFIAATAEGVGFWDGSSPKIELFARPESHLPVNRFNDGAVGPGGRFWAGTMCENVDTDAPPPGSFYRVEPSQSVEQVESGLFISNGLGWSPDQAYFYLTDSVRRVIYRYHFNQDSGQISGREEFIRTPDEPGVPDGLAIDAEGCIWSARWGGWNVTRYSPQGEMLEEIRLPVAHPTSCAFGGRDLSTLYITSAWTPLSAAERADQPLAGDIFAVKLDVPGQAPYRFAG
jgi:sugar lactone lactonase YvrE